MPDHCFSSNAIRVPKDTSFSFLLTRLTGFASLLARFLAPSPFSASATVKPTSPEIVIGIRSPFLKLSPVRSLVKSFVATTSITPTSFSISSRIFAPSPFGTATTTSSPPVRKALRSSMPFAFSTLRTAAPIGASTFLSMPVCEVVSFASFIRLMSKETTSCSGSASMRSTAACHARSFEMPILASVLPLRRSSCNSVSTSFSRFFAPVKVCGSSGASSTIPRTGLS